MSGPKPLEDLTAAAPPAQTLRDCGAGRQLLLHCPACDAETRVNLMRWASLVGWDTRLDLLAPQLPCGSCGNKVGNRVEVREGA